MDFFLKIRKFTNGMEKELKDFRVPLFAQCHVDNDLLRFSYGLTRPPRMADSTSISSNFGAVWKLRENQGHEKFHRIRKRQSSRSFVACEFNFPRCFAAHSYVCSFIIIIIRYYFQSEYRNARAVWKLLVFNARLNRRFYFNTRATNYKLTNWKDT